MSSWWKTLVVLILIVPMTAYVVGSLSSSGASDPADRGPVILDDPSPPATPPAPEPSRDVPVQDEDARPGDDRTARVVTPEPVPVDDDDDAPTDDPTPPDERGDDRDGDDEDDEDEDGDDEDETDEDRDDGGDD